MIICGSILFAEGDLGGNKQSFLVNQTGRQGLIKQHLNKVMVRNSRVQTALSLKFDSRFQDCLCRNSWQELLIIKAVE